MQIKKSESLLSAKKSCPLCHQDLISNYKKPVIVLEIQTSNGSHSIKKHLF